MVARTSVTMEGSGTLETRSCQEPFNSTFHLYVSTVVEKPLTTQSYAPAPAKNATSPGHGVPSGYLGIHTGTASTPKLLSGALNARSLEESMHSLCIHLI